MKFILFFPLTLIFVSLEFCQANEIQNLVKFFCFDKESHSFRPVSTKETVTKLETEIRKVLSSWESKEEKGYTAVLNAIRKNPVSMSVSPILARIFQRECRREEEKFEEKHQEVIRALQHIHHQYLEDLPEISPRFGRFSHIYRVYKMTELWTLLKMYKKRGYPFGDDMVSFLYRDTSLGGYFRFYDQDQEGHFFRTDTPYAFYADTLYNRHLTRLSDCIQNSILLPEGLEEILTYMYRNEGRPPENQDSSLSENLKKFLSSLKKKFTQYKGADPIRSNGIHKFLSFSAKKNTVYLNQNAQPQCQILKKKYFAILNKLQIQENQYGHAIKNSIQNTPKEGLSAQDKTRLKSAALQDLNKFTQAQKHFKDSFTSARKWIAESEHIWKEKYGIFAVVAQGWSFKEALNILEDDNPLQTLNIFGNKLRLIPRYIKGHSRAFEKNLAHEKNVERLYFEFSKKINKAITLDLPPALDALLSHLHRTQGKVVWSGLTQIRDQNLDKQTQCLLESLRIQIQGTADR